MSQPGTDLWTLGVIIGLTVVTVVTRSFFFLSSREWQLPHWAQRGLQYAPIAALSAVIVPEVVMTQGQLITTWQDAASLARRRAPPSTSRDAGRARPCWAPSWWAWRSISRCTWAWVGSLAFPLQRLTRVKRQGTGAP